ncbi:MAG: GNAT family N-acetyltransferase [Candidatus Odinarchaeota archaeon]
MTDNIEKEKKEIPVFIEGRNISLVPQNSDHINIYVKWSNDPKVRKLARWETPRTVEDVKNWFEPREGRNPMFIVFEIWHKKDKKPIGQVGLSWIDWINGWANAFAYIGEPEYWSQGITTEATQLLIEYAFNELNLNKLQGGAAVENVGSWSVAEKVGFKFEGIRKNEMYVGGKYLDVKTYRISKEDWIKSKN